GSIQPTVSVVCALTNRGYTSHERLSRSTMPDDRTLVRVLDVDPELGYQLDDENRAAARRYAVAELRTLDPGPWPEAHRPPTNNGNLGLLVLDGLLAHELQLGNGQCSE